MGLVAMRHICGISGGKDSTALALHLRATRPDLPVEYYFSDTGAERPGTYETIDRLEELLAKPITRLQADRDLFEQVAAFGGLLPSHNRRWCTRMLKIEPFERWVGDDETIQYVGIRADERKRVNTARFPANITCEYPLVDDGIDLQGVHDILAREGVELPAFYEHWSRSGCWLCFYQRNIEWVALAEQYPELYERAIEMEEGVIQLNDGTIHDFRGDPKWKRYGWREKETLVELRDRKDVIRERHQKAMIRAENLSRQLELQWEDATTMTDGFHQSCPEVGWCDR